MCQTIYKKDHITKDDVETTNCDKSYIRKIIIKTVHPTTLQNHFKEILSLEKIKKKRKRA